MLLAQVIPGVQEAVDAAESHGWEASMLVAIIVAAGFAFMAAVYAVYKFARYVGQQAFDKKDGYVTLWFAGEQEWRGELTKQLTVQTERLEKQTVACDAHVVTVQSMGESLTQQIAAAKMAQEAAQLAQDAARLAAEQMTEGNKSLSRIDDTLQHRTDMLKNTAEGVTQLKACVFHMCDVCQALVAREFPESVSDVSAYLTAIKKKVNDEPPSGK